MSNFWKRQNVSLIIFSWNYWPFTTRLTSHFLHSTHFLTFSPSLFLTQERFLPKRMFQENMISFNRQQKNEMITYCYRTIDLKRLAKLKHNSTFSSSKSSFGCQFWENKERERERMWGMKSVRIWNVFFSSLSQPQVTLEEEYRLLFS